MTKSPKAPSQLRRMSRNAYRRELHRLQIELVKLQRHVIAQGERMLVIFEGRDAAGKDGTIKHITEHLSPRDTRVLALGPPPPLLSTDPRLLFSSFFSFSLRHSCA